MLEERFFKLYRQPTTINDIALDLVIMSEKELILVKE